MNVTQVIDRSCGAIARIARRLLSKQDLYTAEGRSAERYRRAILTIASSALGRGATVICGLVSVPLAIKHLGVERYGVWLTISSMLAFSSIADFGVGDGMMSALGRATGKSDRDEAKTIVSSGMAVVAVFTLVGGVCFAILFNLINWVSVFNVAGAVASAEVGPSVAIAAACFGATMLFGVVSRVNRGLQQGYINHLWQAGGSAAMLALLVLAIESEAGLPVLVLVLAGTPVLALAIMSVWTFWGGTRALAPESQFVRASYVRRLLRSGSWFMLLGAGYLVVVGCVNVIVARRVGIANVAEAGVPMRMFGVVNLIVTMIVSPLWPAFAEADSRGDRQWLVRTARVAVVGVGFLGLVASGLLVVFGRPIINFWVGDVIIPSDSVLAALGVWATMAGLASASSAFVAGVGLEMWDAILRVLQAGVLIGSAWVLAPLHGVSGVLWMLAISETLFRAVPLAGLVVWTLIGYRGGLGVAQRG